MGFFRGLGKGLNAGFIQGFSGLGETIERRKE